MNRPPRSTASTSISTLARAHGDSARSPESVVRRLIDEAFSEGKLDVCDELIADQLIEHQDFGPRHPPGPAGVKAVITSLRRAFSDFTLTIEDLVVAGDTVWIRNLALGTNDRPYMGHPPTGRRFCIHVFDVLRVDDGRVVEHWGVPDRLGVLLQLGIGVLPASQPATSR
jgi:predicted ester cyclase